jgi:glycosyltransferase involved in cell wall biosynthesis
MMRSTISAVIITKNEEKILSSCLKAIKWVDEIIVVDSGSTDKTIKIAKKFAAKVYFKNWEGYAAQKNFAISKARSTWILNIDADEVISEDLKYEIIKTIKSETDNTAFDIPFKNMFYGKCLMHGGLSPDRHIRLFKNKSGKYPLCLIHESLEVKGEIGHLKSHIIHHTKADITTHVNAINTYTNLEMTNRLEGAYMPTGYTVLIRPVYRFIKYYFFRCGFLDGIQGLVFHVLTALYLFLQEVKILEKKNFKVDLLGTIFKRAK